MFEIIRKIWKSGVVTDTALMQAAPERYHGRLNIQHPVCKDCEICANVCPTGAITLYDNAGKRKTQISYGRCVFCGLCAESCPDKNIMSTQDYHLATKNRPDCVDAMANSDLSTGIELEKRIKEVLGRSLHIRHVDSGSCNGCDFEMSTLTGPVYDIQRLGIDFVASPRHADMLMVTGGVTRHLEEALRKTYNAAADPKLVVAVGTCACGGGIVGQNYANHGGVDKIAPVFVYIPGCPPRPQALIEGILLALDRGDELQLVNKGKM